MACFVEKNAGPRHSNFSIKQQLVAATPPSQGSPFNLLKFVWRRRRTIQTGGLVILQTPQLQPFDLKAVSLGAGVPHWTRVLQDMPHNAKKLATRKGALSFQAKRFRTNVLLEDKCLVVDTVQNVINVSRPSEILSPTCILTSLSWTSALPTCMYFAGSFYLLRHIPRNNTTAKLFHYCPLGRRPRGSTGDYCPLGRRPRGSTGDKIASRCGAPRPPMSMTDVGTETAFRLDRRKSISEKVNISWGQRSVDAIFTCVDLHVDLLVSRSINMLSVTDFVRKGIISGLRVQAGLSLDMLDADRSPNAVSVHAGTSQVDFEVDCPPPACLSTTRRFFDHHGKRNGNFV